MRKEVIVIVID